MAVNEFSELKNYLDTQIIGQPELTQALLIAVLADGHLLVEGPPGLAKTRAVNALAKGIEGSFQRVQFTPDLLPADITGSEVYVSEASNKEEMFQFRQGPIFGNLVLVDEINRAPPKVQSALLEAMEERQITVSGTSYSLPKLFITMATQNPVEQEGTYNLPEAQLDRFLMKILVEYPTKDSEKDIMRLVRGERAAKYSQTEVPTSDKKETKQYSQDTIFSAWQEVANVHTSDEIEDYVVSIIDVTRNPADYDDELAKWLGAGASPRATLALDCASRAHAWLEGRDYTTPVDVQAIIHNVLRHRLMLSFQAASSRVSVDAVIDRILSLVVPA